MRLSGKRYNKKLDEEDTENKMGKTIRKQQLLAGVSKEGGYWYIRIVNAPREPRWRCQPQIFALPFSLFAFPSMETSNEAKAYTKACRLVREEHLNALMVATTS